MEKKVKTTKIEKKYKDKKTGEYKSLTIDYAKVPDRLKAFWEANPKGKIETTPTVNEQGQVIFKAHIIKDKSDEFSGEATGHTLGGSTGEKDFEKLETLSVGRALALLGYAGSGEVASSEEMEEFMNYQNQKKEEAKQETKEKLEDCKNIDELKTVWASLTLEWKQEFETLKAELKTKLEKKNDNK